MPAVLLTGATATDDRTCRFYPSGGRDRSQYSLHQPAD